MSSQAGGAPGRSLRPRFEVADIFRVHAQAYRAAHVTTPQQRRVMWAIQNCRTAVLGGHVDLCQDCGHGRPSYNSCRNRHCPKCQALDQARWLDKRKQRILPTHYFHVVFTLPRQLRRLTRSNQKLIYKLLFAAASQSLLTLGRDPKRLGALLGITAVLHTWTRDLRFHPHLHCVVTGGGISEDRQRWVDTDKRFLFYVKILSRLFRGKFLDGLEKLYAQDKLKLTDDLRKPAAFKQLRRILFKKDWVVYVKRPFAGPEQVFGYLGRYTHRVAISNSRILNVTDHQVTIATKDRKTVSLSPSDFIGRFLQHVLPKGFFKIRYFGLLAASHVRTLLPLARQLLDHHQPETDLEQTRDIEPALSADDLRYCPICGSVTVICLPVPSLALFTLLLCAQRAPPQGEPE